MHSRFFVLLAIFLLGSTSASAQVFIALEDFSIFAEEQSPQSLEQAIERFSTDSFTKVPHNALTFGIGSPPIWLHMKVENTTSTNQLRRLQVAVNWVDHIDVYLIDSAGKREHWQAGDHLEGAINQVPGVGTAFTMPFAPGMNDVYVRAVANDPLVLPIELSTLEEAQFTDMWVSIAYGLLYGFLIALVLYNLMFYRVLKHQRYLYYALYVGSFIVINFGYTGQGMSWFYPDYPRFQNFSTIFMMVIYSIAVLEFAVKFLELQSNMPRVWRYIKRYQWAGFTAISLTTILNNQLAADWVSFSYIMATGFLMLVLGIAVARRVAEGYYFLAASVFGMIGILSTGLSSWGFIPFTHYTYHGSEIGVVIEATIFAIALAKQLRSGEEARLKAEHLASHDPLTGLRNRRSFYEQARKIWRSDLTNQQPHSLIMADVDHFKQINDTYGHGVGDEVLKTVALTFFNHIRYSDLIARWGGEEFVLLLPNTRKYDATNIADKIRMAVENTPISAPEGPINVSVSFGVADQTDAMDLEQMIVMADKALLDAKQQGRNRVVCTQGIKYK